MYFIILNTFLHSLIQSTIHMEKSEHDYKIVNGFVNYLFCGHCRHVLALQR